MGLLQRALVRTTNYIQDQPWLSKRWVSYDGNPKSVMVDLPFDGSMPPKSENPRWRAERPVVLLQRPHKSVLTRVVMRQGDQWRVTVFSVAAEYFTMRIDNESTAVALMDVDLHWTLPKLVKPGRHWSLVLSQELMGEYIACCGLDCTHV